MVRLPDPPLSSFGRDFLELACRRCNRYGKYKTARLLSRMKPDCPFPDVVTTLADCPHTFYEDPCQVEVVRERPRWWKPARQPEIGRVRLRED